MEQNDGAGNSLGAKLRKLHIEGKGGEGKKGSEVESGEGSWLGNSEKGPRDYKESDSVAVVLAEDKESRFSFPFFSFPRQDLSI